MASTPTSTPPQADRAPLRVLVAAGPTHEAIDDVRYIGNRSSGRMGLAIADAFLAGGCAVTLARGPGVPAGPGCTDRRFTSAADLLTLLRAEWPSQDVLVMAAAVADYRPAERLDGKLRRDHGPMTLELVPTEDILSGLAGSRRADQYVVGFALERPDHLEASARAKLARKRADVIIANPLATMDSETVDARLFWADGSETAPGGACPKAAFAGWLADQVLPRALERCGRAPASR